jgi:hypothetical protein
VRLANLQRRSPPVVRGRESRAGGAIEPETRPGPLCMATTIVRRRARPSQRFVADALARRRAVAEAKAITSVMLAFRATGGRGRSRRNTRRNTKARAGAPTTSPSSLAPASALIFGSCECQKRTTAGIGSRSRVLDRTRPTSALVSLRRATEPTAWSHLLALRAKMVCWRGSHVSRGAKRGPCSPARGGRKVTASRRV